VTTIEEAKPRRELGRRSVLTAAAGLAATLPFAAPALAESRKVIVGGLPVTCNLTLPIACATRFAAEKPGATASGWGCGHAGASQAGTFEFAKYSGWPEIKESLMSGRIQAAYMLAPLVMDLTSKKIPIKIVSLGHRSGAVIMVRTDSGYKKFTDLRGKRIAVPSRFAVDFLFLRKMLKREGMTTKDIELMEMPPPDMPAALYAKAVDAYCTGEPFGAAAQRAGYATPLKMTRDEWRNYICCCLTVREELIKSDRRLVQDLVDHVQSAGLWLDENRANRTKAAELASGRKFFNQDKKIIEYVMENPTDRVTYGDLRMIREEFDELMQLSREAETIKKAIPYESYVDESFVKSARPVRVAF
jgi:NitT/TauT family transport system substrate-binding protein